jgi:hypothetical protein
MELDGLAIPIRPPRCDSANERSLPQEGSK